jgi:hypothetical protein
MKQALSSCKLNMEKKKSTLEKDALQHKRNPNVFATHHPLVQNQDIYFSCLLKLFRFGVVVS